MKLSADARMRLYGSDGPLPMRIPLRAGPLALSYEAGDLRYVRFGRHEVVRRIYAAVRDRNWGTVPGALRHEEHAIAKDRFRISYESEHRAGDIHFVWRGDIVGEPDGTVRFIFDGEAKTSFLRNRIGFCVLHPTSCTGARYRIERGDGSRAERTFPRHIEAAQPVPGLTDLTAFGHQVTPDAWAELRFEGDLFEMEDQRNWIDASYKTFCTPLRLPYPVVIKAGTRIVQRITLAMRGAEAAAAHRSAVEISSPASPSAPVEIEILQGERRPLPDIGLGCASHGRPLSAAEQALFAPLRLKHLRVDVALASSDWPEALRRADHDATALSAALELAVHLPAAISSDDARDSLSALATQLGTLKSRIARVLPFRDGEKTSSSDTQQRVRAHLAAIGAPIGAGTNADFYQLNQFRPPHAAADFIAWSMNPQVHAFDLASLAETPSAIPAQLESARVFFPGKPLVVSPVTLKPRFNPVATGSERPPSPGELPPQVDSRQLSQFGAGWTLAVLKHLAEAGAASITLFETTGWRGVIEIEAGSALHGKFPSRAGEAFPLFQPIVEVSGAGATEVIVSRSSDPLRVEAMVLAAPGRCWALLANLTADAQEVLIAGSSRFSLEVQPFELRRIDLELRAGA